MCGSICGPTGSPIACSRAMRPSSRRPARPGATSWPNLKQSPQSECAIGHISVRDKGPWYQSTVRCGGLFSAAATFKDTRRIVDGFFVDITCNKHYTCAVILCGPMVENFRWMENMLNSMNHHGLQRVLRDIHDTF